MRWTEVISIRASVDNRRLLTDRLQRLRAEVEAQQLVASMLVLQRLAIDTDLCVCLEHNTDAADPVGSEVAQRLVEALKPYGLVHHSIWIVTPAQGTGPPDFMAAPPDPSTRSKRSNL